MFYPKHFQMFFRCCSSEHFELKVRSVWEIGEVFSENITSCACLDGSQLNVIFYWKIQSPIIKRSLFLALNATWSCKTEEMEILSAKSLVLH